MRLGFRSEIGYVRRRNEDAVLVPAGRGGAAHTAPLVVAVADGMGGHPAGDVASRIAVDVLTAELGPSGPVAADPAGALVAAMEKAHRAISADAAAHPDRNGMGTTVVAAVVRPDQAWVGHVGDSRAYLVRGGTPRPLTRDHSRHGFLVQALGLGSVIEPDITPVPLEPADRLLLCSDGLTGLVPEDALAAVAAQGDVQEATDALVDTALALGGHDNVSVVLVEV
jgi:protein phosphatase